MSHDNVPSFLLTQTNEQDLVDAFSRYGAILETKLIFDRATNRSRGFAFITFEDPRNADDALAGMQGYNLQGREIRVDKSAPKGQRPPRFNNDRGYDSNRGYNGGGYDRGDRGGYPSDRGGYERDRGYDRGDRGGYDRGFDRGGYPGDRGYERERGGYPRERSYDRGYNDRTGPRYPERDSGFIERGGGYDRGHGPERGYDRGSYPPGGDRNYGYENSERGGYNDRGYQRGPTGPPSKGVCFQWQKGDCRFGSSCRYSHDTPPGGVSAPDYSARGGYDSYDAPR